MHFHIPYLVAVTLPLIVAGSKDYSYYPGTNKLVDENMYWADSENVLADLGQFHSLYVTYHNCA